MDSGWVKELTIKKIFNIGRPAVDVKIGERGAWRDTCPFRYWGRRLVWNSSGRTVSSSSNARQRARPSTPPPSSWNTRTISATAPGQASGMVLSAREANATHSLVSTILEPEEKQAIWENSWLFRDSYWSVGISDQYREILVWSALAPKYWISGTCERRKDGCKLQKIS